MWELKYFKTYEQAKKFMWNYGDENSQYKFELLFVENGFAVEYKKITN